MQLVAAVAQVAFGVSAQLELANELTFIQFIHFYPCVSIAKIQHKEGCPECDPW